MSQSTEVKVPNIGDFSEVEIIEVHPEKGDAIDLEDPLITLESDKATIDVPSPVKGIVTSLVVSVGDKVSEGDVILTANMESSEESERNEAPEETQKETPNASSKEDINTEQVKSDFDAELVVLGSGPGGYTAAFRAADLGLKTILVERYDSLGGVCLNVGCIPSKALLHAAKVISEAKEVAEFGITFPEPEIDISTLRAWKEKISGSLAKGLEGLAKQRKLEVVHGTGAFLSPQQLKVNTADGDKTIGFKQCIIAAGSQASQVPVFPEDPRIIDSTGALELADIPERLLVIGGGIIGLEMATVYHELGAKVTVVEMLDTIIADADADIVRPLQKRIEKHYENIYLSTQVTEIKPEKDDLIVSFKGDKAPESDRFDRILVAVGRRPNGDRIAADKAGVQVDERAFIPVDKQQRTNVPHIYAIGDIVGQPMLAHKAAHEGKVAAEVAAGLKSAFDAKVIPSVAYTDPEVAWVGLTETEAKAQGIHYGKGVFPWAASGRSLSLGRSEGVTKLLFSEDDKTVLGAGIAGPNAGDLIAEVALAIEMGADAEDLGLTIHPHPTLSETIAFSAEAFEGTITDLYMPKKT